MKKLLDISKHCARLKYIFLIILFIASGCKDFLDVVPDDIATLEDAFALRTNAQKYLHTCYSYLPRHGNAWNNIGLTASDEIWFDGQQVNGTGAWALARDLQNSFNPIFNMWSGGNATPNSGNLGAGDPGGDFGLWRGIRECNTFLENVSDESKIPDLSSVERNHWLGEVEFLKAYYHFYLLRMYGPIPIMRENIPISASKEEVQVERQPVDEVFEYIVELLDQAATKLDLTTADPNEYGKANRVIALSLKAKVLLYAASPLFNGNTDMSSLVMKDGTPLFNQEVSTEKWARAKEAIQVAIDAAESAGHSLYVFENNLPELSDTTILELSLRQAVTENFNSEIIWGNTQSRTGITGGYDNIQQLCIPPLVTGVDHNDARKILGGTYRMAKLFYSSHGVPIEEDRLFDFTDEISPMVSDSSYRYYVKLGQRTARLNFDREPRFYSSMSFNRAVWYKSTGDLGEDDDNTYTVNSYLGEVAGSSHTWNKNYTGYFIKKLVDWTANSKTGESGFNSFKEYAWPEMRLAELYLMHAEAANEAGDDEAEVFRYLNKVRERAGLLNVDEAWQFYSKNPGKYQTQSGRREIIKQERMIELAFEGHRFWDLRRWKDALEELNKPIKGWLTTEGDDYVSYYQLTTLWVKEFTPRDYFWPIADQDLLENPNLLQNVGW
jgi:hypothetical protein